MQGGNHRGVAPTSLIFLRSLRPLRLKFRILTNTHQKKRTTQSPNQLSMP